MLKLYLILQIMNYNKIPLIGRCLKEKKKVIGLMKDELGGKIVTKFVGLRAKTYSYSSAYEKYEYGHWVVCTSNQLFMTGS